MVKVVYHGEAPNGSVSQYGYDFEPGKSVEVKDENHLAKLSTNRFFEVAGKSDKDEVKEGQAQAEANEAESLREYLTAENVPFHHRTGLDKLRELAQQHQDAQEKAQEA